MQLPNPRPVAGLPVRLLHCPPCRPSHPSTNPVLSLVTRRFRGPSNRLMPGGNLHIYPCQDGWSRGKKACLFIWKRYRAVAQLARNRHILGEILSAKPGGAHPQQIPSWLPDPVPLDSSKQKGKVLPRVFARKMHVPASLSLESLAGG